MPVSTLRRAVVALALVLLIPAMAAIPATAQTAASVMEDVRNTAEAMFEDVDNYIMKTDMYTAYYKKEDGGGPLDFRSAMQMQGQSRPMGGEAMPDQYEQYGKIGEHGTYVGTETINGINCHVIRVDDPSKVDENLSQASEITYFVGVNDNFLHRMRMAGISQEGSGGMTMNMKDYRTIDGVALPFQMEMITEMSEEQRQQMEQMKQQMESMPEAQRERMQKMMGSQMENLMNNKPIVIEVNVVIVNGDIPDGVF
jgi:hypothetical protein